MKPDQKKTSYTLAKVTIGDAIKAALAKFPGKAIIAELEDEDGYLIYSIEIIGEKDLITEVEVDAGNSKVLASDVENEEDTDEDEEPGTIRGSMSLEENEKLTMGALARISIIEAIDAALARFPGKAINAELEDEDGYLVFEVEVVGAKGIRTDVKVDAGNGKILASENEGSKEKEHEDKEDED